MQNNSLISIIMPVYNSEKYLNAALKSLIGQSYSNIEIICVDDGSTDASLKILDEYARNDNRVKVYSQKNRGPASARNKGLKEAQGEYIMFCDSDDTYQPEMCKKMMDAMQREDVDLVRCNANVAYEENVERMTTAVYGSNLTRVGRHNVDSIIRRYPSVLLWHQLFKKSIIDKYNISFPDGLEADDGLFCYEYYSVCETVFGLKDKLYNYRIRYDSIMDIYHKRKKPDKIFDRIKIFKHFYNFLKNNRLQQMKIFQYLLSFQFLKGWELYSDEEKQTEINITKNLLADIEYKPSRKSILDFIIRGKSLNEIKKYIESSGEAKLYYGEKSILQKTKILFASLKKYNKFYRI